jgi:predicted  nucleic acid-binding Zn-ribbon protein
MKSHDEEAKISKEVTILKKENSSLKKEIEDLRQELKEGLPSLLFLPFFFLFFS